MKKLLLLLALPFIFSCSKDDDKPVDNRNYSAHMKRYCDQDPPQGSTNIIYDVCISKETYDYLLAERERWHTPCLRVTFTSLDGEVVVNDYFIGVNRGITDCYNGN